MKEKVVSFKTSDELYNKLKETGKSFRSVIEPLIITYLNEKHSIPHRIPKETSFSYDDIDKTVDAVLERFYGK